MEIRQLRYFATVAQTLNFSEAARRLYITQGTLSQQIQQLEFELGSVLFERSSHSVSLTEAGEELLPLALDTIAASEACLTRMRDLRGALTGTLRIGAVKTFKGMLTGALKGFMKLYSGVSLTVQFATAEELLEQLRANEIDLALAYNSVIENEDVESEVLYRTSLHVVMRKEHPLAERAALALDDLHGYGVIIPGRGLQARRSFDRFIGIDTRKLDVRMEVNDPDIAMSLVQGSDLLAISSPLPAFGHQALLAVPLEAHKYQMTCCIHRLKSGYRKKSSEVFVELLRDSAQIERIVHDLER